MGETLRCKGEKGACRKEGGEGYRRPAVEPPEFIGNPGEGKAQKRGGEQTDEKLPRPQGGAEEGAELDIPRPEAPLREGPRQEKGGESEGGPGKTGGQGRPTSREAENEDQGQTAKGEEVGGPALAEVEPGDEEAYSEKGGRDRDVH